jgi:hypothetical protein
LRAILSGAFFSEVEGWRSNLLFDDIFLQKGDCHAAGKTSAARNDTG